MRRYGVWGGNPDGVPEDKTRCMSSVTREYHSGQCARNRGFGPDGGYCKQHAKEVAEGRDGWVPRDVPASEYVDKAQATFDAKLAAQIQARDRYFAADNDKTRQEWEAAVDYYKSAGRDLAKALRWLRLEEAQAKAVQP